MDLFSGMDAPSKQAPPVIRRDEVNSAFAMRPYQGECVDAVLAEFGRGVRSTLVVMATGLGKTVVFSEVCERWLRRE